MIDRQKEQKQLTSIVVSTKEQYLTTINYVIIIQTQMITIQNVSTVSTRLQNSRQHAVYMTLFLYNNFHFYVKKLIKSRVNFRCDGLFYVAIGYRVNSLERFESLPHIGSEIKHALLARKPSNCDSKTAPGKRLVD